MIRIKILLAGLFSFGLTNLHAQNIELNENSIQNINVNTSFSTENGENTLCVLKDSTVTEFDENTFARIENINFSNGTIEVEVLSRLLVNSPDFARGFIGIAFRINDDI